MMTQGSIITLLDGQLQVPENPIIHYIEGDGIGIDITPVMIKVVDNAVNKAYGGSRNISWSEVLAGQKAFDSTGEWLPNETCRRRNKKPKCCTPSEARFIRLRQACKVV